MTATLSSEETYKNVLRGLWNNHSGTYKEWETLILELPHYSMTEKKARALEPGVKESLGIYTPGSLFDKPALETSREKIAKRFIFFSMSFIFFLAMLWVYQRVDLKESRVIPAIFAETSLKVVKQRNNKSFLPFDKVIEIKGGNFLMGSSDGDFDEEPVHRVHLLPFPVIQV